MKLRFPRATAGALLAAVAASLLLAACGEKQESETAVTERDRITLILDYFPNADHAAIYAAQGSGAFERAGLEVEIKAPGDTTTPLKALAAGKADAVITYEPELLLAREQGQKVQSIAALVQEPLSSVLSLRKNPVRTAADLRGKTVGTAGLPYQAAYLDTILTKGGVPASSVKRVDLGFNLTQPLLAGKVDATLGAFWNYEAIELRLKGRKPVVTKLEELGVPTYNELVLATTERNVRDRGPIMRRLVQAISTGANLVREDPSAGLDPLLQANRGLDPKLQREVLQALTPVMFPKDEERPFGWQDPAQWNLFGGWLEQQGLVKTGDIAARAYTNEFLPGEGLGDDDGGGQSVRGI